jgi:hypothetical protein
LREAGGVGLAALVVVAAAVLAACHGAAGSRTIGLRVRGNPERGSAPGCVFVIHASVVGGGTQTTCLTEIHGTPGPNVVMHSAGRMTFDLPRGRIDTRVRITQRFGRDGVRARQTTTGTIAGGSAAYAGVAGTIEGGGTVADRFTGIGPVDLTYTFTLRGGP